MPIPKPYELLVRYAPSGAVQGAHVQWQNIDDSGAVVGITEAQPIAVGAQEGFPLADILDATTQAALLQADELRAKAEEADRLKAENERLTTENAGLETDLAALRAAYQVPAEEPSPAQ